MMATDKCRKYVLTKTLRNFLKHFNKHKLCNFEMIWESGKKNYQLDVHMSGTISYNTYLQISRNVIMKRFSCYPHKQWNDH